MTNIASTNTVTGSNTGINFRRGQGTLGCGRRHRRCRCYLGDGSWQQRDPYKLA